MKYLPVLAVIVVQQLAMIFFMRVARWDLFVSAGASAGTALAVYCVVCLIQRRLASRKNRI